MRESTYTYPLQNRACVSITPALYDRRALDVRSSLPLLNNLTGLTYLTSTSPRIREVMTQDGGLERLLDIMRDACEERGSPPPVDFWGLNGPTTARVISVDRQNSLKHSLAFQSVVNIGVRGSETVRTRVVQSGALDLVAHILESWMVKRSIWVHPHTLGSKAAVLKHHNGGPVPIRPRGPRIQNPPPQPAPSTRERAEADVAEPESAEPAPTRRPDSPAIPARPIPPPPVAPQRIEPQRVEVERVDADIDMGDSEVEDPAIQSAGEDVSMEIDPVAEPAQTLIASVTAATPRASGSRLPSSVTGALDIPMRQTARDEGSRDSSGANSLTESEDARIISDNEQPEARPARHRPSALNLHVPGLANGGNSNQSSPMGTPTRTDQGEMMRQIVRRDTITARPAGLAPPIRTRLTREAVDSGVSDNGDTAMEQETVNAGIAAAVRAGGTAEFEEQMEPPEVEIVEVDQGVAPEEVDPELLAAEQARLDMEAGAPPGQPGAATTPPGPAPTVIDIEPPTPAREVAGPLPVREVPAAVARAGATAAAHIAGQAQVIIANGAPRGFHELSAYVGISSIIHPKGDRFSDDSVLLALQLLAYLSKYPHVRTCFHHPSLPMHRTFEYDENEPLNERPHKSVTRNMFSLVERFTFRPSAADPGLFRVPNEIQYWAGVIMRNACRKDELQSGIRQCASMSCGKWETFAREFAKCRRCRKAKYCSKTCQSAAWSEGHRFWCNPRPDADAPPDPNATVVEPLPGQSDIPPGGVTGVGRLGLDFWELALRLSMQNPPYAALARMLADTPVPEGFDFDTILRWIQTQLAPLLWARTEDQEMFLDVVRQQPAVIQSLYIQSQGDPRALAQGVEMTMMQARLQQRQRQIMRRVRAITENARIEIAPVDPVTGEFLPLPIGPQADVNMREETTAALRQQIEADRPRQPRARTTTADTERNVRPIPPRPVTIAPPGNWTTEIPAFRPPPAPAAAPVPASRMPIFGQTAQAGTGEAPRTGGRTFSLTEVWRNMAQRNNNNTNNNNTDNNDANNQGRR